MDADGFLGVWRLENGMDAWMDLFLRSHALLDRENQLALMMPYLKTEVLIDNLGYT
jgi:hypothetical protein